MEYRLLQPKDNEQFIKVFEKAFDRTPDMKSMTAVIGIDKSDEIVSFLGLYTVLVVDSMWVKEEYRRKGVCIKLAEAIKKLPWKIGKGFYMFSVGKENYFSKKYLEMQESPAKLWVKIRKK